MHLKTFILKILYWNTSKGTQSYLIFLLIFIIIVLWPSFIGVFLIVI